MKITQSWLLFVLFLTGCTQFEAIPYSPEQTPESWLVIQPILELEIGSNAYLIVQPTTSAIVYVLGLVTIGAGLYFLAIKKTHRSRLWWGLALLLWGIGALLAGTSYEAFSYQIKCAGRAVCMWTSWWEIGYLIVSVASVDAMLIAQAYACMAGGRRQKLISYAVIHAGLYTVAVLIGTAVPVKFLLSFELLLIVTAPTITGFIILNGWRYYQFRQKKDGALLITWGGLVLTIAAYFLYLISGLTQQLWDRGLWFSENDVLHIGLIIWMAYIALVLAKRIEDEVPSKRPLSLLPDE